MYINENIYQSYILIFILNEKPFLLENMVSHIVNKVKINSMVVFVFVCQRLLNIIFGACIRIIFKFHYSIYYLVG